MLRDYDSNQTSFDYVVDQYLDKRIEMHQLSLSNQEIRIPENLFLD